jgi:16S rRNA processing protein RimM
VLGRVIGAHGVAGVIRVRVLGDGPEHLLAARELWLARDEDDPAPVRRQVVSAAGGRKPGGPGEVRIGLEGVGSREEAAALRGRLVLGRVAALTALAPGEHYWFELVGCRVELRDGRMIGRVVEIWDPGAHDVLVVDGDRKTRHLVPVVDDIVREVDVPGRRIVIEPIPGLLDGVE